MHDLRQLAADAEFLLSERHGPNIAEVHRLAAFVADLLDETPADEEWVAGITVMDERIPTCFIWRADTGVWFCKRELVQHLKKCTRGRVRLFALGMGLTLREDGR